MSPLDTDLLPLNATVRANFGLDNAKSDVGTVTGYATVHGGNCVRTLYVISLRMGQYLEGGSFVSMILADPSSVELLNIG